jgi:hypothetical protein
VVAGSELRVTAPKSYTLYFSDAAFNSAVVQVFGRALNVKITTGDGEDRPAPLPAPAEAGEDSVTNRALANPEVQRFREVFGGEVRRVRNLKE